MTQPEIMLHGLKLSGHAHRVELLLELLELPYRYLETSAEDRGSHTVCTVVTAAFLAFSRERGNDLSTPRPEHGFPGLRPGDRWCLCAPRWKEALDAGVAPPVVLASTHEAALRHVSRDDLLAHAADSGSLN